MSPYYTIIFVTAYTVSRALFGDPFQLAVVSLLTELRAQHFSKFLMWFTKPPQTLLVMKILFDHHCNIFFKSMTPFNISNIDIYKFSFALQYSNMVYTNKNTNPKHCCFWEKIGKEKQEVWCVLLYVCLESFYKFGDK